MHWYDDVLKKYAEFNGRAGRFATRMGIPGSQSRISSKHHRFFAFGGLHGDSPRWRNVPPGAGAGEDDQGQDLHDGIELVPVTQEQAQDASENGAHNIGEES